MLQENAEREPPETALSDAEVETDEMFQNAGEKGEWHGVRKTRRAAGPTDVGTGAPMRMTGPPSVLYRAENRGKCDCDRTSALVLNMSQICTLSIFIQVKLDAFSHGYDSFLPNA